MRYVMKFSSLRYMDSLVNETKELARKVRCSICCQSIVMRIPMSLSVNTTYGWHTVVELPLIKGHHCCCFCTRLISKTNITPPPPPRTGRTIMRTC